MGVLHVSRITHEQAYFDRQYLWKTFGPARDMTGGYVDQDDLEALLRRPTKEEAARCLRSQITYWFEVGPDSFYGEVDREDPTLLAIAERHGTEMLW